ncbi:hypothetical protein MATL_G00040170 [Megalops atlanticus]|uniref:Uncharacterized protein n=1 Tax=Megalops atlanticus TaxID=7932 RepID=A0A9D3TA19_MEGAT|nr:hypothetical protein MATL_G00040170 [Megalops atlanticus]
MSSMKRQSSWQEDIARNFSRLFLRSKSQEPQKTGIEGSDISSHVKDDEPKSPCAETGEDSPQQELVLELSKTFHGSGGERERAEVGEEEGEACSVLGDAGGSPPRPPSSSPPRSPAAPGPGTPTAPLDAFFRRLGSLFHLSSKAEPASEELQQAEAAEAAEVAALVPHPDPVEMTRVPEGSREPCDPSGRRLGEADADHPRQEGRGTDAEQGEGGGGKSESGELPHMPADPESVSGAQTPEEHAQPDLQGTQHLVLNEAAGEEGDVACGVGAADEQAEGEADEEQRRRLALSCPPVITYGTYRGLREIKKMRRRNRVQVDSPISEGEEAQQSPGGVVEPSPPGKGAQTEAQSVDCQGAAALSVSERASCNQKGAQASVRDGDSVAPTRPGLGSIPVIIASENGQSQSALPQEQEPDLASAGGQTTDSRPGAVSAASLLSAAEQDSSDKQTVPAEGGGEAGQSPTGSSAERATQAMAETVTEDTKARAEPTETLSPREGSAGSPSETGDVTLSAVGCARGTAGAHQPAAPSGAAALSRHHGCQSSRCSISPSAAQEAEDSEGPVPGEWAVGVQEYVPAVGEGEGEGEWIEAEGDPVEDTGPAEEALQYESRLMVDNILRSALAALQKIESFERENGAFPNAEEASSPVLSEKDNNTDSYLNPEYRQQESLTEHGEGCYLAVEQTQGPGGTLEGNRSTLSSGYESIVGSDTDIRNNPGFSGNEVVQDSSEAGVSSHDRKFRQADQNGTGDAPALLETTGAGDQSFALVEGYLATVIEDDSGGEEDSRHIVPGSVHANTKGEHPEDLERPASRTLTSALDPDQEDAQQWSAVKAYRCHVLAEEPCSSEALRRVAGAAAHDDASGRAPGLAAPGKKVHPDLPLNVGRGEPPGPHLHRFHELDFAIINEEEEADAVFVNDTGTMLSPTTRRGKIYPFSLSPIFEEECGREEASTEDLQEPPVTEEDLRSVEQQASSILSLLQSVSERLQSSAFADAYEDSSEDLSPPLRRPLWGCLSDQAEEDGYADDKDQSMLAYQPNDNQEGSLDRLPVTDEAGSFSSSDNPAGSTRVTCLLLEDDRVPSTIPDSTTVPSTPFYEYLKSARSSLPPLDTDNKQPHSQVNLCQSGGPAVLAQTSVIGKSSEKVNPRPTQMHIYDGVTFSGERREIHVDVEDATGMAFPNGASVRVLRGWSKCRTNADGVIVRSERSIM